jgi:hypothetical protein
MHGPARNRSSHCHNNSARAHHFSGLPQREGAHRLSGAALGGDSGDEPISLLRGEEFGLLAMSRASMKLDRPSPASTASTRCLMPSRQKVWKLSENQFGRRTTKRTLVRTRLHRSATFHSALRQLRSPDLPNCATRCARLRTIIGPIRLTFNGKSRRPGHSLRMVVGSFNGGRGGGGAHEHMGTMCLVCS